MSRLVVSKTSYQNIFMNTYYPYALPSTPNPPAPVPQPSMPPPPLPHQQMYPQG